MQGEKENQIRLATNDMTHRMSKMRNLFNFRLSDSLSLRFDELI